MSGINPQLEEKEIGLLLHSIPYLGGKTILKILTPERGLLTLIGRSKSKELLNPFHISEWVYKIGDREMGKFLDGSIEERFSFDTFAKIEAASQIGADLLSTQLPGKSALHPLELARACLRALATATSPGAIAAAFRLKLLRLEGIFDPDAPDESLSALPSLPLITAALPELQMLCHSRSFAAIQTVSMTEPLKTAIQTIFKRCL